MKKQIVLCTVLCFAANGLEACENNLSSSNVGLQESGVTLQQAITTINSNLTNHTTSLTNHSNTLDEHSRTLQSNSNAITELNNSLCTLKKTLKNDISIEFEGLLDGLLDKLKVLRVLVNEEKKQREKCTNDIVKLAASLQNLQLNNNICLPHDNSTLITNTPSEENPITSIFGTSNPLNKLEVIYMILGATTQKNKDCSTKIMQLEEKQKNLEQELMMLKTSKDIRFNTIEQTLTNYGNTLTDHTDKINNHNTSLCLHTNLITNCTGTLLEHTNKLNDHTNTITTVNNNVTNNTNILTANTNRINAVEQTLTNHTNTLGNHTTSINNHTNTITTLNNNVNNNTSTLSNIPNRLNTVEQTLANHTNTINTLDSRTSTFYGHQHVIHGDRTTIPIW